MSAVFALLDDATDASRSRLYTGLLAHLQCDSHGQLDAMLAQLPGRHVVLLMSYELGAQMHGIAAREQDAFPAAQALVFEHCESLNAQEALQWLQAQAGDARAGIIRATPDIDEATFTQAIHRIREYIAAGDTYQVNYTYRVLCQAWGDPAVFYLRLRERQPAPYGAFIRLPDDTHVLSLSPELFVRHEKGLLQAKPMKGTAAASGVAQEDRHRATALADDIKNRAENLMIVDLLRNDLGRVAVSGSVQVPKLFEVRSHGRVLQMTSTVEAQLRPDCTLAELLNAIYPCGSITGAPKRRTMQIIRELEASPRGLYTGAIGYLEPAQQGQVPDLCLSVPIRTLVLQQANQEGIRSGVLGVGAGIVHDSDPASELQECQLKARFLTGLLPQHALFETTLATSEGVRHVERHLARMQASARELGMRFDIEHARTMLHAACAGLELEQAYRLRLQLEPDGKLDLQCAPLAALHGPVRVLLAEMATDADDALLRHKSTRREFYDRAWKAAEVRGAFDQLFFNQRGELTEGGRSNVFIKLDGQWHTPALACGLLPGVMRAVLIEQWQARESVLLRADLLRADEIVLCNALRGALSAQLILD